MLKLRNSIIWSFAEKKECCFRSLIFSKGFFMSFQLRFLCKRTCGGFSLIELVTFVLFSVIFCDELLVPMVVSCGCHETIRIMKSISRSFACLDFSSRIQSVVTIVATMLNCTLSTISNQKVFSYFSILFPLHIWS